jgi:GNAT superfamily N-acetyltransferase
MIRRATTNDLPQLSQLFDAYRIFYRKPSDIGSATEFLKERMKENQSVIFVDEENGTLTGFTQLYPQFSSTRMQRTWLLNDLYIQPSFRGKGISKKLIEASKQLARDTNAAGLLLETEKSNITGNQLYPATDFVLYNETNFYWWDTK